MAQTDALLRLVPEGVKEIFVIENDEYEFTPEYLLVSFQDGNLEGALSYQDFLDAFDFTQDDIDGELQLLANLLNIKVTHVEVEFINKVEVSRETYWPGTVWKGSWDGEDLETEFDDAEAEGLELDFVPRIPKPPAPMPFSYETGPTMGTASRIILFALALVLITFLGLVAVDVTVGLPETWMWWPF